MRHLALAAFFFAAPVMGSEDGLDQFKLRYSGEDYCGDYKFSQLETDGGFINLQIIFKVNVTNDVNKFLVQHKHNAERLVFLVTTKPAMEKGLEGKDHPFAEVLKNWDPLKAPIGLFCKYEDFPITDGFDHLTNLSREGFAAENFFELWKKSETVMPGRMDLAPIARNLSLVRFNQKEVGAFQLVLNEER